MKFKIFTMLVTLVILSVVPMIYMGKFEPMAFFDSSLSKGMSEFKNLKARAPESLSNAVTDKKVQIYKWRDKNGIMQFSNTLPLDVTNAESVLVDPNNNLVNAIKIPEKEEPKSEKVAKTELPSPYSIKGIKKVMDDARDIEAMLQQRHEEQQKMVNNL